MNFYGGARKSGKTVAMQAALQAEQLKRFQEGLPALRVWYSNAIDVEFKFIEEPKQITDGEK